MEQDEDQQLQSAIAKQMRQRRQAKREEGGRDEEFLANSIEVE